MSHQTVDVPCVLCGSRETIHLYSGPDRLLKHAGTFHLLRCTGCGLIRQSPRPLDLAPFYEGSYLPFEAPENTYRPLLQRHVGQNQVFSGSAGLYYGVFRKTVPWQSGRLLDVGCAIGDFLVAMDHFGWEVAGTDVSSAAAAQANARLAHLPQPPVHAGSLESAAFPAASFDVVTLWHVIEHLPDPLATLHEVRRVLRPGGICLIQTPHWGSLESFLFGSYWAGYDLPRHLWIFSQLTLLALIERAGLRLWQRPACLSYGNVVISCMFWAAAQFGSAVEQQVFRSMHHPLPENLARYLFRPIDYSGAGSQLTVAVVRDLRD